MLSRRPPAAVFLTAAAFTAGFTPPAAADQPPPRLDVAAYWENDGTYIKPNDVNDRHYTNGIGLSVAWQPDFAQDWAGDLPALGLDREGKDFRGAFGLTAGQLIFTPQDLALVSPDPDDQPYAGYLYAGAFFQRSDGRTLDHVQLDLGMVGPSAAGKDTQNSIHDWREIPEALGWDNQLYDEFTFQFHVRRKWRFNLCGDEGPGFAAQVIPEAGIALGTVYRHAEAGATLRLGLNLPDDFGPGRLANLGASTGVERTRGWGIYAFVRATGRVVEHNLFIDGNTFRDSPGVTAKPLVGELQAGAALQYTGDGWGVGVTYSQTYLTEEFRGQPEPDAFGALTISGTVWY